MAFAHRGEALTGGENTMEAFAAAVERGFGYLELDVHTTRDGVVVVFHDEELERVSDGRGAVADHDHADIAALRVSGRRIPRFEDVLAAWSDVRLNVDIKDEASVGPFAALVNKYAAHDRVLVASFSDARRHRVLRLLDAPAASSPGLVTSALAVLLGKVGLFALLRPRLRGVAALQVPERQGRLRVVTPRFLAQAHREGIQVHVWVVNEREDMDRLIDLGVDGIMTDRADVLAAALEARGFWPQREAADKKPADPGS
ncbi:MAG: glycerophosphodiester phosphodiesterase [Micrococcaceae bacterium]|nr:glycerophosphodiester phosphodiesterase [Micrococcaceae bacterium]MDN6200958.1 glycerophosphodiester phosphodiesterase [Micrococcaceae bacterium]MDN6298860.1 glycerophosphodiester phosphodiesterase [Micrococcaceae bacterium]MDN6332341.1 glycerophosphodiester phosphodiesterase [Micrococcaceae bacterium]